MPRFLPLVLLLAAPVAAQPVPALVTDRPDQTESALAVLPGWVQVETGVVLDDAYRRRAAAGTLARLGVARGVEVRLGLNAAVQYANRARAEVEQVSVGGKLALREGETPLALLATVAVPLERGPAATELRVLYATDLAPGVGLGINAGATVAGGTIDPLYTVALGAALSPSVGGFAEVYGSGRPFFDAGLTWLLAPNVQLDASAGRVIGSERGTGFVGFGVSFRLPR